MSDHSQHLPQHLSDEEVLQFIDNELPADRAERLRGHMAACAICQDRQALVEGTLESVNKFYASEKFESSSMAAQSRTQLRQKLREDRRSHPFWRRPVAGFHLPLPIVAATALILIGFAFYGGRNIWKVKPSLLSSQQEAVLPNRALTPGAVHAVTLNDICSAMDDDLDPSVSPATERAVLQEYGLPAGGTARDYQIDYLVNPQLGGTSDIKNLWPEPYSNSTWNAHAKDELEQHLHQMVCNRTVDLAIAQRELATDWIAAYKKYVRRDS